MNRSRPYQALSSCLILILLASCGQPNVQSAKETTRFGSLSLKISDGANARTIQPLPADLGIVTYVFSGSGPAGVTLAPTSQASGTFNAPSIDAGDWTITILGKNSGSGVVASATTTLTVPAGGTVSKTVQLLPEAGNGTISITQTWPNGVQVDTAYGTLTPDGGATENISFVISGNQATYTASKPAGAYTLVVGLSNAGQLLAPPRLEAVMVYKGMVSPGTIAFTASDFAGGGSVTAPFYSVPAGIYDNIQTLILSTSTAGASIRYTTDGSIPTGTVGTLYTGPITIAGTKVVKAIAYLTSWTNSVVTSSSYIIQASTPVFSVAGGTYNNVQTLSLSTTTAGASIRYTTDGTPPTNSSGTLYSVPFAVSTSATVKAIAYFAGFDDSGVASSTYVLQSGSQMSSIPSGTYDIGQVVTLTSPTAGATIKYTLDGSEPSSINGTIYTIPLVINSSATLKAYSYASGFNDSPTMTFNYVIVGRVGAPVFGLADGTYATTQTTTLTTSTPGALIRYTTDGSDPSSTAGIPYSVPIVLATTQNLKAIAYIDGWPDSTITLGSFTINGAVGLQVLEPVNLSISIQGVNSEIGMTASPTASLSLSHQVDSVLWFLDNSLISGATANTLVLGSNSITSGPHNLVALAKKGTSIFSASLPFSKVSVKSISAGGGVSAFVSNNGTLWVAGQNNKGQLGDGTNINRSLFAPVATGVAQVACGEEHTMLLKTDGSLWATGGNTYGQLGDGTHVPRSVPVQVASGVTSVAVGSYFTIFLKANGTVWTMGYNAYGQLGSGDTSDREFPTQVMSNVASVGAGGEHALFVKSDGNLYASGYNYFGQLGDGTTVNRNYPVLVMGEVVAVSAGSSHTVILKNNGAVWVTGGNDFGQLGDGTIVNKKNPFQVMTNASAVSAGGGCTMILKNDRSLWASGINYYGQLGDGTAVDKRSPVQVAINVQAVSAGGGHTLMHKSDGSLWAVGFNGYGQLGNGNFYPLASPVRFF